MPDGTKSTDLATKVKTKRAKADKPDKVKADTPGCKSRGIQTERVIFMDEMDYPTALRYARSLAPVTPRKETIKEPAA